MATALKPTLRDRSAFATDDLLRQYLEEISAYPLLTREAEVDLARRIQAGDRDAIATLVCSNLRFVVAIAKRYRHRGASFADLINEGNLGLMRAAERFDPGRGVKFTSYAVWWVRQAIMLALAEHAHAVHVPAYRVRTMHRIGRRANSLRQELGREPTRLELAGDLHVSEDEIEVSLPMTRAAISLDEPVGDEGGLRLVDLLPDENVGANDDEADEARIVSEVHEALDALRPREAKVVKLYFGLDGNEAQTLEHIGEEMGITRERVRQIKERALWRIRRSVGAAGLSALIRG